MNLEKNYQILSCFERMHGLVLLLGWELGLHTVQAYITKSPSIPAFRDVKKQEMKGLWARWERSAYHDKLSS